MLCRWNQHSVVSQLVCYCRWVGQLCLTLCNPFDCNTPGFPVPHRLLEFAQVHVHWISDAIQPSHPLLPSSSFAFNFPQHQGLFQWVNSSHFSWPKDRSLNSSTSPSNEYSGLISRLTGLISMLFKGLSRVFLSTTVRKDQFFGILPSLRSSSPIHTWLLERPQP